MRLLIRSLILSLIILSMISVAARAQNVDDVAESFQAGLTRLVGEVPDRPARLALWSGPEKGMPVAASVIYGFEADLQKALLNLKPAPEILARSELSALIGNFSATGALDDPTGDPVGELLSKVRDVDALVIGDYRLDDLTLIARYRLVSLSGQVLAVSGGVQHALTPADLQAEPGAVALDVAVDDLSNAIVEALADTRELQMGVVRLAGNGGISPFGEYIRKALTGRLLARNENMIGAAPLQIINQGAKVTAADIPVVSGDYWLRGTTVSLIITVMRENEVLGVFQRQIRMDSLGGLRLVPDENFDLLTMTDDVGPPTIGLSMPGGLAVLKVGDPLMFDVRLSRAGYLWCYYIQADGLVRQVVPNPGLLNRRGDSWLDSGTDRRLPVPERDGFRLVAAPPGGPELLKCLVTDRDVRRELPQEMQALSLDPLPPGLNGRIVEIFRSLPNLRIAEDSLFITVVDPSSEGATSVR